MGGILLHAVTAALYGVLGWHFWRTRWRAPARPEPGMVLWERIGVLVPLVLHTLLLHGDLFGAAELRFGFGQALSVTLWLAVLIYWIQSLFVNLEGMQAIVLPLAAVSALLPAVFPGFETQAYTRTVEFRIHLLLAMLAYSFFTIGAMHAALMAIVERRLHRVRQGGGPNALAGPLAGLPPLLTLEALLFRILALGFVLLTLTLITGSAFSEEIFGRALPLNHKTVFAIISWLIFGSLLVGRYMYGWRGRKALRWTLAGFAALLLAYVGSRFVLEVLLGRGPA